MAGTQVWKVRFGDDTITTTLTSSGEAVEKWIAEHRLQPHCRRCLIFQLIHADYHPEALDEFLGDSDYRFVGVGVEGDAKRLWDDWELDVSNTVDLADLAAEEMERPSYRNAGLKAIAKGVMNVDMEKPHRVTTGPWDAYSLSGEQIEYACIDAFVSFEVGRRLFSGDY
ncbi:hypothetical protein QOZ80_1AG0027410 [Eleusine coracana subsp. coracana]|nr:hypothetical protein QOZ80_1AG0027410 [Eleusine coracana subsp. coracana]